MIKCRRSCRKRPADHLKPEHVAKKAKSDSSLRHHATSWQQQNITSELEFGYKHCSILPNVNELCLNYGISPHVKPHIVKGRYNNWHHYLNTQFYLLREDFVAPLRKLIFDYKDHRGTCNTGVYQKATFTEMVLNENGVLLSVELKTSNNVNFINGTLLCFSSDDFKTILFAMVVSQQDQSQNNQVIHVKMESDIDELSVLGINNYTQTQEYIMIEAPAHYETYYQFLSSIKHASQQKMPFKRYLIDCNRKIHPPLYLNENSVFNMAKVLELHKSTSSFDILNEWPNNLNESQAEVLQHALTHEIALIQGPPGTGKTFIGTKIIEALLINRTKWDHQKVSPILVVCYTNQALDQFLEKILDIKNSVRSHENISCSPYRIVRIGGGCKSDKVEECSIKFLNSKGTKETNKRNVKKPASATTRHYYCLKRKLAKLSKDIKKKMELLIYSNPPPLNDLLHFIAPVHFDQLSRLHESIDGCIKVWLHDCDYQSNYSRTKQKQTSLDKSLPTTIDKQLVEYKSNKNDFAVVKLRNCQVQLAKWKIAYIAAEAECITDITILSPNERKKLYHYWIRSYQGNLYNGIHNLIDEFNAIHAELIETRYKRDAESLKDAQVDVVGMTTTGAAKNRKLLEKLKPKIVIVEEAAEVMESNIIPCLTATTEHLILIGDHKQLQPKPHEYHLAKKYNLNVSLFERLILNDIAHVKLTLQYRMRPEIAELICPHIYPKLQNAINVKKYKNIRGITTNMYFFNHNHKEGQQQNSHSYYNAKEAEFVAGLCNYLLKQDYEPSKITVLAAYTSQVARLMKLIPAAATVDVKHTQMEEASEDEQFVKIKTVDNYQGEENDIIILSLVRSNDNDKPGFLEFENRVCVALSRARKGLYCFGNFDLLSKSTKSDIWQKILDDLKNKNKLGSTLQLCCANHPQSITTITRPADFQKVSEGGCWLQCNTSLNCGHKCMLQCHIKDAHHANYRCKKTCLKKCSRCGESCKHECFMDCQRCETQIEKIIPGCNHVQLVPCYMEPEEYKCTEKCTKTCVRGHPCTLMCSEVCMCMEARSTILDCGHRVTVHCFNNYAAPSYCTAPCKRMCTTNTQNPHKCTKQCSEICGNCEVMVDVILPWCGHHQQLPCYMQHNLNLFVDKISCTTMMETTLSTCGHTALIPCGTNIDNCFCSAPVTVKLSCGHHKDIECYKTLGANQEHVLASEKCIVKVRKKFQTCKHDIDVLCCDSHLTECPVKCNTVLLCGHRCSGTCHECHEGRLHKPCMFHVSKLLCGHTTTMKCSDTMIEPYPSCTYRCERFCPHTKCSHKCQDPCKPCRKPCNWQCSHFKCSKQCHEKCDRQRCYHPCPYVNKCRHPCIGVCGERCPDVCKICDKEQFLQLYVSLHRFNTKDDTTYIQLDCGHLFKRTELDPWVDARSKHFQLISCPKCNQTIHLNQRRYANAIMRVYDGIRRIGHAMNTGVRTSVKLEALVRYHMTIEKVIKVTGLLNPKALLQGLSHEELEQFAAASDEELKQLAAACSHNTDTKFCQGIKMFVEDKKENNLSAIDVIINIFDSTLSLLKFSQGNLDIIDSLEVLLKFTMTNHKSLSLQVIQDTTRELKRLTLLIMAGQLKNAILDHQGLQTIKHVENVLIIKPGWHHYRPLLPQQAKQLYLKLSKLAKKYGVRLVDEKYLSTPKLPLLYTGSWTQCIEGHYYCVPRQLPDISCDFLTNQECPHCSKNEIEYMDAENTIS